MGLTYRVVDDLAKQVEVSKRGIATASLYEDGEVKMVLHGMAAGHELVSRKLKAPVLLHLVRGMGLITVGVEALQGRAGIFVQVPQGSNFRLLAWTAVVVLLVHLSPTKETAVVKRSPRTAPAPPAGAARRGRRKDRASEGKRGESNNST
ncbi:MAG: hypothetical protein HYY96_16990 [Candidatus Tectomicrobia bacterium]|nr:hypothetical protein [Candidatus Tectomicrobia bacterium]